MGLRRHIYAEVWLDVRSCGQLKGHGNSDRVLMKTDPDVVLGANVTYHADIRTLATRYTQVSFLGPELFTVAFAYPRSYRLSHPGVPI